MEASQLAGSPSGVWFSTSLLIDGIGHIGFVSNRPGLRLFALPGFSTGGIAYSKSGVLWFTETEDSVSDKSQDFIVRTAPGSEKAHRIKIPTLGAWPGNISIAPDGRVFFCENARAVGEVVNGKVVEHRLPVGIRESAGALYAIATSRSNTFVIEDRLSRIVVLGREGSWSLLETTSQYGALASSPTGVWFTDPDAHQLGLITESGHRFFVKRFSVPWDVSPVGLTVGGGAVYFTTGKAFFGRFNVASGFSKVQLRDYDPAMGAPSVLQLQGKHLWYTFRVVHQRYTAGAIGYVNI